MVCDPSPEPRFGFFGASAFLAAPCLYIYIGNQTKFSLALTDIGIHTQLTLFSCFSYS